MSLPTVSLDQFSDVCGIVLVGGRSSRMGQDKATLPIAGKPMLQRVVQAIAPVVRHLYIVAEPEIGASERPSIRELAASIEAPCPLEVIHDAAYYDGPLAGIATGLAAAGKFRLAYVSSCDVPLLRTSFVQQIIAAISCDEASHYEIAAAARGDSFHPLAAIYHTTLARSAAANLATGNRRLKTWVETHSLLRVEETSLRAVDPELLSLRNVNTPADLEAVSIITRELQ